ncbi:MAG: response regulator [Candidatus Hydrogenedentota bacterium]
MPEGNQAQILIVDSHPLSQSGLRHIIAEAPGLHVCGATGAMEEAVALVAKCRPDLVLLELELRRGSGISFMKSLLVPSPGLKVLVTSRRDERLYAERSIRAGAMGYISKDAATEELVAAMRRVLAGKVYVSGRVADHLLQQVAAQSTADVHSLTILSDRELEVFELLGEGLTTRQVAAQLHLCVKTVESHRGNIKEKLGLENSNQLLRRAVAWNLRADDKPDSRPS